MKQIVIDCCKSDKDVLVCIQDPTRRGERCVFYCPISCIGEIIESNLRI